MKADKRSREPPRAQLQQPPLLRPETRSGQSPLRLPQFLQRLALPWPPLSLRSFAGLVFAFFSGQCYSPVAMAVAVAVAVAAADKLPRPCWLNTAGLLPRVLNPKCRHPCWAMRCRRAAHHPGSGDPPDPLQLLGCGLPWIVATPLQSLPLTRTFLWHRRPQGGQSVPVLSCPSHLRKGPSRRGHIPRGQGPGPVSWAMIQPATTSDLGFTQHQGRVS